MNSVPLKNRLKKRAFSLIELMTAMTILVLLTLLIAKSIQSVSTTLQTGKARIDDFLQARSALDMITRDLQGIVLRRDLAAFPSTTFAFYTQAEGENAASGTNVGRPISLVQYSLINATTNPSLQRSDYSLAYPTTAAPTTVYPSLSLTNLPDLTNSSTQTLIIGQGVIAFQWQFIDATGTLQSTFQFNYATPSTTTNIHSVTLALLVLDNDAYNLAKTMNLLPTILSLFSGTPATTQTYGQYWTSILNTPGFGSALPIKVRDGLRVFQSTIPLNVATIPF